MSDYVYRTLTAVHNVNTIPLRVCASIFAKIHTDYLMFTPVVFFWSAQAPCKKARTDFYPQYVETVASKECAFWGLENEVLHLTPFSWKERKFSGNFQRV